MEIKLKVSQRLLKEVKEMTEENDTQALNRIRRVAQNFLSTEEFIEDIFDGEI